MKIDKHGSLKYKQIKRMEYRKKMIRRIAIGTIAISIFWYCNDFHFIPRDVTTINYSSTVDQTIGLDDTLNNEEIIDYENEPTQPMYPTEITNKEEPTVDEPVVVEPIITEPIDQETETVENEIYTPTPIKNQTNDVTEPVSEEQTAGNEHQERKMVALSFDDGPAKTLTRELLDILAENNCTATFFVLGNRVNQYSDIIYEAYSAGNEIGNHSYDHSNLTKLSKDEIEKQIQDTNEAIYAITNEYPTFVRPPYGSINDNVKTYVDCPMALWSIDSNDWRKISDEEVINNVISSLEDGKIILMHDIHERTIKVSKTLIPKIKELGYEIVSIKELYEAKEIELEDGCVYSKAKKN